MFPQVPKVRIICSPVIFCISLFPPYSPLLLESRATGPVVAREGRAEKPCQRRHVSRDKIFYFITRENCSLFSPLLHLKKRWVLKGQLGCKSLSLSLWKEQGKDSEARCSKAREWSIGIVDQCHIKTVHVSAPALRWRKIVRFSWTESFLVSLTRTPTPDVFLICC